ncbi:MAG: TRAP transporter large permease subunit, partial [Pseudomonadales bacterium]
MSAAEGLAVLMFLSFMGLLFTGFPVAWVLGGLAVLFTALAITLERFGMIEAGVDWAYASMTVERSWDVMTNWVLVALPMFIFMGLMLDRSGMAQRMMNSMQKLFGGLKGGLSLTVLLI